MSITTNPDDPKLTRGVDESPVSQAEVYLVLSEEERAKGFVRPLRSVYKHVGNKPIYPTRKLTAEEHERYDQYGYVLYEEYPPSEDSSVTGRFWTKQQLDSAACGATTTMGYELSATYARQPTFYGSTYCTGCNMHRPVSEFVWLDGETVGS